MKRNVLKIAYVALLSSVVLLNSCSDDPVEPNEPTDPNVDTNWVEPNDPNIDDSTWNDPFIDDSTWNEPNDPFDPNNPNGGDSTLVDPNDSLGG